MKNINLKQNTTIYIWKFINERNYQGWNFASNNEGANFILKILDEMKNSPYSSKYTLKISSVNKNIIKSIGNNLINSKIKTISNLNLISKSNFKNCELNENYEKNTIDFLFDKEFIKNIEKYFQNIKNNIIDVGLECENENLIFWKF